MMHGQRNIKLQNVFFEFLYKSYLKHFSFLQEMSEI